MSITTKRLATACVAACLATGLSAAPAASAADGNGTNAAAAQKKKAKAPTTRKLNSDLKKVRTRTTKAEKNLRSLDKTLKSLQALANKTEGSTKLLLTAAPQLVTGLTQAGAGLKALQTALEGTVAPALKALEKGLKEDVPKAITEVATSQEYGVTRVVLGPGGAGGALPFTFGSADIPDDGNTVTASGELPIPVGNTPAAGQVPGGTLLTLRSAIRSGEADGDVTGDPAGYVGGVLTMKCAAGLPANGGACDLDPTIGVSPVPAGTIVCVVGPAASQTIALPDGTSTSQGVVTIQEDADRTDQTAPTAALGAASVNPLAGAADNPAPPLNNNAADGCNLGPNAGDTYVLTVQTQFVDLPTSLSPKVVD